jgi:hypothetical protein
VRAKYGVLRPLHFPHRQRVQDLAVHAAETAIAHREDLIAGFGHHGNRGHHGVQIIEHAGFGADGFKRYRNVPGEVLAEFEATLE